MAAHSRPDPAEPLAAGATRPNDVSVLVLPLVVTGDRDRRRIPGRARSHTSQRKWETFRLFGSLDGHLAAHRHRELPAAVTTAAQAAGLAPGTRVLAQPRGLRPPERPTPVGSVVSPPEVAGSVRLPKGRNLWAGA